MTCFLSLPLDSQPLFSGVGALLGFMAAGPLGALAGAVGSAMFSKKDNMAGETVRTAARAANVLWEASGEVTGAVSKSPVGSMMREGLRSMDGAIDNLDESLSKKKRSKS